MPLEPPSAIREKEIGLIHRKLEKFCEGQGYAIMIRSTTSWITKSQIRKRRSYFQCHRSMPNRLRKSSERTHLGTNCPFKAHAEYDGAMWSFKVVYPYHNHPPGLSIERGHLQSSSPWQKPPSWTMKELKRRKAQPSVPSASYTTFETNTSQGGFRIPVGRASITTSQASLDGLENSKRQDQLNISHHDSQSCTPCPLCEVPVPENFWEEYCKGQTLRMLDQHDFCHEHQLRSARLEWRDRNYPHIEWSSWSETCLSDSATAHLLSILNGSRGSHYADMLAEYSSINKKATQSFMQRGIVDAVPTGYFGHKGAQIMANTIFTKLGPQLSNSFQNRLLQNVGMAGYVQAVLVPELSTILVQSDMGLSTADQARQVLKQSSECGNLLNPEDDDVIET